MFIVVIILTISRSSLVFDFILARGDEIKIIYSNK